ncbi:MAG: glycosyltransferase family 4 protein [Methyloversatilis discipulorum]|uniref:glycosyltransferase family 4 protein n=1 Tax=Methyloversatilis discipulorum TaxID=1119528 RepID=UPI0026F05DE5|nr:glycosyltransferase family 4 protein [Methyloversatilis discipulorum]MBT9515876.1 glycosyltransferase family 4 protein [Methyloversatilis discipulorum]
MRILFLSFYYTPDLCAGSFRAAALIRALRAQLPAGSQIDVITTMPNRYSSYSAEAPEIEDAEGISVRRILLPSHKSGMRDQSKVFLTYARRVHAYVSNHEYDLVFATSSRLMTAVLGARIARSQKAPLYLDIRDIFVDTIRDILPRWLALPLGGLFSFLERYAIGTAAKVNLVSRGFEPYFSQRYSRQQFSFFPNGIDDEFIVSTLAPTDGISSLDRPLSVLYAGNLGEGQGLHSILPGLARALRERANFTVIGDGGRKNQLKKALEEHEADNVTLLDPVNRDELIVAYQNADVLFLHLNDHNAFRKVLPSKIFEYAATGKPICAGVAGYAAKFISEEVENAQVFPPCDVDGAIQALARLQMRLVGRKDFVRKYQRRAIMRELAMDIVSVGRGGNP